MMRAAQTYAIALAGLSLCGCGSEEIPPPEPPQELRARLGGAEDALARQTNFWIRSYGAYLTPTELEDYNALPERARFERFGRFWLGAHLREDLLDQHRWRLSRDQLWEFRSLPSYDDGADYLRFIQAREQRDAAADADRGAPLPTPRGS